jgi:hypothetical protein
MTEFNKLLAAPVADFIRRRFGEDIDVSSIAPELLPVIALQVDRPEWLLHLGELPLSLGILQALNAAQNSAAQIRNPPGSNTIVMVDEVEVSMTAAGEVFASVQQISAADMTTLAGTNIGRDTRSGSSRGMAQVSSQNNVATTNIIRRIQNGSGLPWVWRNLGVILAPGSALQVSTGSVNESLSVSFVWRERRVRPEELSA